jgi:autotransporter-associated beta strand protein
VTVTFDKTTLITVNRDISGISGVITNLGAGLLRFNSGGGNNATGSADALWILDTAGGFIQPRNASVNSLGAVAGLGTISAQQSGAGLATWLVGALNTSTTFEGVISDGASFNQLARYTAIAKVGTGTWTLNNVSMTHRSSTVVSNGTLALVGVTSPDVSTNIVVAAPGVLDVTGRDGGTLSLGLADTNQTLRGDGTIQGNLVLGANSRLMSGFSTGVLTVSGTAQLSGAAVMEISRGQTPNSDRLTAQSITLGGTLIVTNIGGQLAAGDSFQLFSAPTLTGSFASAPTLPDLNCSTLAWDTSNLTVNGTITVTGTSCQDTTPTSIIATVSGNQLELQWPTTHLGWELQTNAVSIADPASWFTLPGSATTNRVFLIIDPSQPNVFYRMNLP